MKGKFKTSVFFVRCKLNTQQNVNQYAWVRILLVCFMGVAIKSLRRIIDFYNDNLSQEILNDSKQFSGI